MIGLASKCVAFSGEKLAIRQLNMFGASKYPRVLGEIYLVYIYLGRGSVEDESIFIDN